MLVLKLCSNQNIPGKVKILILREVKCLYDHVFKLTSNFTLRKETSSVAPAAQHSLYVLGSVKGTKKCGGFWFIFHILIKLMMIFNICLMLPVTAAIYKEY